MNNKSFPLRLLPDEVQLQVIKSFDYLQLIAFSFISIKTKTLVESFKIKTSWLWVMVYKDSMCIDIMYNGFPYCSTFKIYNHERKPGDSLISMNHIQDNIAVSFGIHDIGGYTTVTWQSTGLSFKNWFQRLRSLFQCDRYSICFRVDQEMFDTVAIRNLVPEWGCVQVGQSSSDYAKLIFELFSPHTKEFCMSAGTRLEFLQKVAIQNFDYVFFSDPSSLDGLLVSNAFEISVPDFSVSDINRFLKLWIRGSKPRLRQVCMFLKEEEEGQEAVYIDEKLILKGIKHQVMPEDLERIVDCSIIQGGFDIRNRKGTSATIEIISGEMACVNLYVWD